MENLEKLLAIIENKIEEIETRRRIECGVYEGPSHFALMGQETAYREMISEIHKLEIEELHKKVEELLKR